MKNAKKTKDAELRIALPVPTPNGDTAGHVVPLGTDGLRGVTVTDRATTALINAFKSAPGLKDGEATVQLLGVALVLELTTGIAVNQFDKIYRAANGVYNKTNTGTPVGYALATIGAPGVVEVAIV